MDDDDALLEQAIAQARAERQELEVRKRQERELEAEKQLARQGVSAEQRSKAFLEADGSNIPHASFMAFPEHPDDIKASTHSASFHKLLEKPAGSPGTRQGTAKERAIHARKMRKWRRNGCRGEMPTMPAAAVGVGATIDEFATSPGLQEAHRMRYASWLMRQLDVNDFPDGDFAVTFTFNVLADRKLMHKSLKRSSMLMHVVLIQVARRIFVVTSDDLDGPDKDIREARVGPDNLVLVREGGDVPREASPVPGDLRVMTALHQTYQRGIPAGMVLEDRALSLDVPSMTVE